MNEEDIDKEFFVKERQEDPKKMKLNKGEKRALKFLLQKETGEQDVDIEQVIK